MTEQLVHDLQRFKVNEKSISSFFIGGGTPSTMAPKLYESFFQTLRPYLQDKAEITVEANPNSATKPWLEGMKSLGVTRISFGVQSFFADKLTMLGRNHSADQAKLAIQTAHDLGFKHLSLDLIYGTKLDTKKRLESEIAQALALPIDHVSSYALTLEENTPFANRQDIQNDSSSLARFFAQTLQSKGFEQYEISNYGTYQCQHNLGYWQHTPYLGIGCGAVGFDGQKRYYPHTNLEAYLQTPLTCNEETLHVKDLQTEKLFLGLRSRTGIDPLLLTTTQQQKTALLLQEKKLLQQGDRLYNPDFFLADEIALFLME